MATQVGGSLTNVLVYDASGKLIAEYGSTPAEANGTQYVTADHQGSPRTITNNSGAVVSRHDYAPFGEDLPAGIGMRSTPQGYSQPDAVRQKYAGMENDDATGMSHTLWRQYDNLSARWTVPNPYGGSMTIANPQSFNRYSYVENDPVNRTDPLGLMSGRDASQSWGDVAGLFWGGSGSFGGPETGTSIINNGMSGFPDRTEEVSHCTLGDCEESEDSEDSGDSAPQGQGLDLPTDPNDLAVLDTVLGEASWIGNNSWGMDDYGELAFLRPRGRLAEWEVRGEMMYMVYTIDNRLHDWKNDKFTGWKDVIERRAKEEFLGYKYGKNIEKIASDPALREKARLAIQVIKDYHAQPLRNSKELVRFYFWKGIAQDNDKNGRFAIMKRGRATRMAKHRFHGF